MVENALQIYCTKKDGKIASEQQIYQEERGLFQRVHLRSKCVGGEKTGGYGEKRIRDANPAEEEGVYVESAFAMQIWKVRKVSMVDNTFAMQIQQEKGGLQ